MRPTQSLKLFFKHPTKQQKKTQFKYLNDSITTPSAVNFLDQFLFLFRCLY